MYRPFPPPQRGYAHNVAPRRAFQNKYRSHPPSYSHSVTANPKEFWCETCDRDFRSQQLLESHVQQHEKCNIDGCQFVAHPKVITKHIQMQHSSGLFNKIANLTNPEAIHKWREERKKKYPTKSNIEKKFAEIQEKLNRGEKMNLPRNKNQRPKLSEAEKKDTIRKHERRHQNKVQSNKSSQNKCEQLPKIAKVFPTIDEKRTKMKPFAGIQSLISTSDTEEEVVECNYLIDDDEDVINETLNQSEPSDKPVLCEALSNLICNYGSSDEEINISQIETSTAKIEKLLKGPTKEEPSLSKNNKNSSDEESGPDEKKTQTCKQNIETFTRKVHNTVIKTKKPLPHQKLKGNNISKKWRPKAPSTLLQKLLFREMRQERNIVLQCIRHIINNNYFDI